MNWIDYLSLELFYLKTAFLSANLHEEISLTFKYNS